VTALATPRGGPAAAAKTRLLLGLGNDLMTDDAVGLHIARAIRHQSEGLHGVEVRELSEMGLSLLDHVAGFDELTVVDAVQTGRAAPGFLHQYTEDNLAFRSTRVPHFLGLREALAFGAELGLPIPKRVRVFAVEVADPFTVGTEMTPAVRLALPRLVRQVIDLIQEPIQTDIHSG
jgi:hydrogenase maturation protease